MVCHCVRKLFFWTPSLNPSHTLPMDSPETFLAMRADILHDKATLPGTLSGAVDPDFLKALLHNLDQQLKAVDICLESFSYATPMSSGPAR